MNALQQLLGISHKRTLAQLIALNTDVPLADLPANVFFAPQGRGRPRSEDPPARAGPR